MNEQLYTIPVNDAFHTDCECPVCQMYETLQKNAIEFVMGPSYMEDDVRMETDKIGFCGEHLRLMYQNQNRLGLGLMLKTHMDHTIKEVEKLSAKKPQSLGLFKKKDATAPVVDYMERLGNSCYVCRKIKGMFEMYLSSMFYLYKKEEEFRETFRTCKGFCNHHYGLLYDQALNQLNGQMQDQFLNELNHSYLENMKRVRDDLEWFTDKFDYRYVNEPWKNSKDALPRTIIKTNSVEVEL